MSGPILSKEESPEVRWLRVIAAPSNFYRPYEREHARRLIERLTVETPVAQPMDYVCRDCGSKRIMPWPTSHPKTPAEPMHAPLCASVQKSAPAFTVIKPPVGACDCGLLQPARFVDIVFDGPPGPDACRFCEVENEKGKSLMYGEWINRGNGYWALRVPRVD